MTLTIGEIERGGNELVKTQIPQIHGVSYRDLRRRYADRRNIQLRATKVRNGRRATVGRTAGTGWEAGVHVGARGRDRQDVPRLRPCFAVGRLAAVERSFD